MGAGDGVARLRGKLQVNYRGSTGFGAAFGEAGFGQWGRKMQTDLSDGVRYLAAEGSIDPKRVCIVGASYGGYAALAGATLNPGVYRCAVSVAGISALRPFVAWSLRQNDVSAQRYFDRFVGATSPTDPRLDQVSPADHIGAATPPILLIHGKDDTVVPFEQSQIMADALRRAGKPVEMVVLRREDHRLSHGETLACKCCRRRWISWRRTTRRTEGRRPAADRLAKAELERAF